MRKSFLKYIAYNRVILNMTLSWELVVCIQHLPCSVSFQCILGHRHVEVERRTFYIGSQGSNLFWHFKEVLKLFGPQWTKIGCTSFNFKHYLQACTPSGRKLCLYMQYYQWKTIVDQLLTKGPIIAGLFVDKF